MKFFFKRKWPRLHFSIKSLTRKNWDQSSFNIKKVKHFWSVKVWETFFLESKTFRIKPLFPIIIIFTYRHIILFRFIRANQELSKLKVIQLFMMLMKREVAVGRSDFLQCANKAYCCFAFLSCLLTLLYFFLSQC